MIAGSASLAPGISPFIGATRAVRRPSVCWGRLSLGILGMAFVLSMIL